MITLIKDRSFKELKILHTINIHFSKGEIVHG